MVAGIHGDEINSFEIARRSFQAIDPQRLNGTLIVVPAANAMGFRTMNRYMTIAATSIALFQARLKAV